MTPFDSIRVTWQGGDLPNDSEINQAALRLLDDADRWRIIDRGSHSGCLMALARIVATSSRDCYAHLFGRTNEPSC